MTKRNKIVICSTTVAVLLAIIIGLIFGYSVQHKALIAVQTNEIKIELDKKSHIISPYDFIDEKNKDKLNVQFDGNNAVQTEIGADSVCSIDEVITLKYNKAALCKIRKNVKISVIDKTPPEFTEKTDTITINKGDKLDVASKFKATDLSGDVEIKVDGNVDVNTAGEQTVNIFASDKNGNVSQIEVKVVINETEEKTNGVTSGSTSINSSSDKRSTNTSNSSGTNNKDKVTSSKKNNTSSNSVASSNSNNNTSSSTTKPSNNSNTITTSGCANGNHSMPTGNIGKWFNSRNEVENYVIFVSDKINAQYLNGEISYEEKCKKVPVGYECWSCSYCGKWTGNFEYR